MIDIYKLIRKIKSKDPQLGSKLIKWVTLDNRRFEELSYKINDVRLDIAINILLEEISSFQVCREKDIELIRGLINE